VGGRGGGLTGRLLDYGVVTASIAGSGHGHLSSRLSIIVSTDQRALVLCGSRAD